MRDDLFAVEIHDRIGHCRVEDERDLAPGEVRAPGKNSLVGEGALVASLVEIVERQFDGIVRQADRLTLPERSGVGGVEAFGEDP